MQMSTGTQESPVDCTSSAQDARPEWVVLMEQMKDRLYVLAMEDADTADQADAADLAGKAERLLLSWSAEPRAHDLWLELNRAEKLIEKLMGVLENLATMPPGQAGLNPGAIVGSKDVVSYGYQRVARDALAKAQKFMARDAE